MVDVSFRDLCFDACLPQVVGSFWSEVLGRELVLHDDGEAHLVGETRQHTVWINRVPEEQTTKNRVHLDVRFDDASTAPGRLVHEQPRWRVLADPEGLVYCAFGPEEGAAAGAFELVVDSADPMRIATWWAERTGATVHQREGDDFVWLEGVADLPFAYWVFGEVPEPKTVKNRVHWDVNLREATLEDLLAAGATVVREKDAEIRWTVLADPEGNEFCAFPPE